MLEQLMENIKSELSRLGITFKRANTESVTFFSRMGDLDFRNKVESLIVNSGNQELSTLFHRCKENSNWLRLYDSLRKKLNT